MPWILLLSLFWEVPVWVDSSDPKDWIWPGVRCCPVSKIGHCPVGMLTHCQTRLSFHQPNHLRVGESKKPEWVPTKNVLKENLVCWLIHFFRSLKVTIRDLSVSRSRLIGHTFFGLKASCRHLAANSCARAVGGLGLLRVLEWKWNWEG